MTRLIPIVLLLASGAGPIAAHAQTPEATPDSVTVSRAFYVGCGAVAQEVVQLRERIETVDTDLRAAIEREREAADLACDFRAAVQQDEIDALTRERQRPDPILIGIGASYSFDGIGIAAGVTGEIPLPLLPDIGFTAGGTLPLATPRPSVFLLLSLR